MGEAMIKGKGSSSHDPGWDQVILQAPSRWCRHILKTERNGLPSTRPGATDCGPYSGMWRGQRIQGGHVLPPTSLTILQQIWLSLGFLGPAVRQAWRTGSPQLPGGPWWGKRPAFPSPSPSQKNNRNPGCFWAQFVCTWPQKTLSQVTQGGFMKLSV